MYNILRIVILVVSYYVLRCMYCILCYLITKLTCSIEEPLCGNAIKSLLLLLLLLLLRVERIACIIEKLPYIDKTNFMTFLISKNILWCKRKTYQTIDRLHVSP